MSDEIARVRLKKRLVRAPKLIVPDLTVSGDMGTVIAAPFSMNKSGTPFLFGVSASQFNIVNSQVVLLNSSAAGVISVGLGMYDEYGRQALPSVLTFTVEEAEALPSLTLSVSALSSYLLQCAFTNNVAYVSYQAALNQDYGHVVNLSANKQVAVEIDGVEYEVEVRGVTAGGEFGPWSTADFVTTPADTSDTEPGTLAVNADLFADSIGVNATLTFQTSNSPYAAQYEDNWLPLLKSSEIRYIRTAFNTNADVRRMIAELAAVGKKFQFLVSPILDDGTGYNLGSSKIGSQIGMRTIVDWAANASFYDPDWIQSFEFANEVQHHINSNLDWAALTCAAQLAFYNYVSSKAVLSHLQIGGPSIWGRSEVAGDQALTKNGGVGWGASCHWQPAHIYVAALRPTVGAPPEDDNENPNPITDPAGQLSIAHIIAQQARLAAGKPCEITECGYQTAGTGVAVNRGQVVSQVTQSKFLSRMFLTNFMNNVRRSYLFAWCNKPDNLVRHALIDNYPAKTAPTSWNVRQALTTINRMIAVTKDPGAPFACDELTYGFTGPGADANLQHMLLQKRNGTFLILVAYDGQSHDLAASPANSNREVDFAKSVTLNLGGGFVASNVKTWEPHLSGSSTNKGLGTSSSGTTYPLTVRDHLMIIEITP